MTSSTSVADTSVEPQQQSWPGVWALSLGIFALIMAEFLPASLLSPIADGLHVSTGAAGQAVSVTAFAAAASALLISVVLPHADRRRVMAGLTVLAIVSNVVVAMAPNLAVLLVARLLLGVAIGGFWALATGVAAHLVDEKHLGRALTVVSAGVSLATVAAVPLGTWLGEVWGWRGVFVLSAGVAGAALVAQLLTLPRITPTTGSGLQAMGAVLRSGVVLVGLLSILLVFAGHFSGFTYVRPATEAVASIDAGAFAALLVLFGAANFLGTLAAGPLADRAPRAGILLFPVVLALGMTLMYVPAGTAATLFVAAALWGFGFGGVPTTVLSWGARTEPTRMEQVGGLVVAVSSLGITVGAGVGGLVVDGVSPSASLLAGAVVALAGGLLLTHLTRSERTAR